MENLVTRRHPSHVNPPRESSVTAADLVMGLTVIIPAYNEAEFVGDTIRSLLAQTVPPDQIILVDDGSTDGTGDVGRRAGITVIRPPHNTGSKAGAQTFALPWVRTKLVMAIDADTTLEPTAVERLMRSFEDPGVGAACGFVLPRRIKTLWERGRFVEYLFAFTFYKQVQEYYRRPMISSGCFSMYRTDLMRRHGGWPGRTLAEDMDLTWTFHQTGVGVRFEPEAVCYPIEPYNFRFMRRQLRRWSHGFIQNITLHWRGVLTVPFLRSAVAVALWDAIVASLVFLIVLPLLIVALRSPWLLLAYFIDAPAILVPLVIGAIPRREFGRTLASLPSFFVLRLVNGFYFLEAVWSEWFLRRSSLTYEKGH